jgi:hypothetical protein
VEARAASQRDRALGRARSTRIVRVAIVELSSLRAGDDRVTKLRERRVRGRILVLEDVSHSDPAAGPKELAQPGVVIIVLMREDHDIDGRSREPESIDQPREASRLGSAIDQHATVAVLYQDRIALPDVEDVDDQRRIRDPPTRAARRLTPARAQSRVRAAVSCRDRRSTGRGAKVALRRTAVDDVQAGPRTSA